MVEGVREGFRDKCPLDLSVSPGGLKPQAESREPISFNAEHESGEPLKRHLEGQQGLNNGWHSGPGNNWHFTQIDFLVIIFVWYLF